MIFHQLLHTNLDELILLSEKQPYVALYAVAAAKKARMEQDNRYEKLLSRAAIRVPSRKVLKQLMNEEIMLETVEREEEIIEAKTIDNGKLSHQEAKEIASSLRPAQSSELQQATEVDEGEIVLDNPLTPKPVSHEELTQAEVIIDGQDQYVEVASIHEAAIDIDDAAQDETAAADGKLSHQEAKEIVGSLRPTQPSELQQATEVDEGEIVLDNPLTPKPVSHEELTQEEVVIDGQDQFVEVDTQEIVKEKAEEQEVSFAGFGSGRSQYGSQQQDVDDFQFVPLRETIQQELESETSAESEAETQASLRKIELPIEDDSVIEIGDELVEEKPEDAPSDDIEVEFYEMDLAPVSSLSGEDEEESMYKKIVQLLNDDLEEKPVSRPEPVVLDVDYSAIETPVTEGDVEDLSPKDAMKDAVSDELESLYAQAAYEATFEKELAQQEPVTNELDWRAPRKTQETITPEVEEPLEELQPQDHESTEPTEEINQLADTSQTHSFSGWLGQLSNMGADFAQGQKEHQQRQQSQIQQENAEHFVEKEASIMMNKEPKPSEKPELTTKQVQEMARKSMQPSKAFYTETLAYVYELQEKWSRAIEVYEQLSLQNPQKSSYFASRIKLLKEKLK